MDGSLTGEDFNLILESLRYTKQAFEDYQQYPSYEFKQERIKLVNDVTEKVKALRDKSLNTR